MNKLDIKEADLFLECLGSSFKNAGPSRLGLLLSSIEYHAPYRALIKLAHCTKDDSENDGLMALSCAVYGWMPTIMKNPHFDRLPKEAPILRIRNIKSVDMANAFLLDVGVGGAINNSWIGTSKLLHVLNPTIFPIWDTRVAHHFGISSHGHVSKRSMYIEYLNFIHKRITFYSELIQFAREYISEGFKYMPTDVRCLELMLFAKEDVQRRCAICKCSMRDAVC
jgi:hypothetical protein